MDKICGTLLWCKDEPIRDGLPWTPLYWRSSVDRQKITYLQQLWTDRGFSLVDLWKAIDDTNEWRKRERERERERDTQRGREIESGGKSVLKATYLQQLCTDKGFSLVDLWEAMDDTDKWRKRDRQTETERETDRETDRERERGWEREWGESVLKATYLQQLCTGWGFSQVDLQEAMDDTDECRERERDRQRYGGVSVLKGWHEMSISFSAIFKLSPKFKKDFIIFFNDILII